VKISDTATSISCYRLQKDLHHERMQLIENTKVHCQTQRDKAKQEVLHSSETVFVTVFAVSAAVLL
jgi:hypothetical protein